ncbi:hypothetical protein GCM10010317_042590 [Streptomyces mirabilis]|nr:hypothetical protein GCM10010317_042590 [Streptomyces mirabilis]
MCRPVTVDDIQRHLRSLRGELASCVRHRDPELGIQLAARILAEIGDDRSRFTDARGLKAYAGSSPITRASGRKSAITRRWVRNDRLAHAGHLWRINRRIQHGW